MDVARVPGKDRLISVDHGGQLRVWDLQSHETLLQHKFPAAVHGLALSKDGWVTTANSDGSILLFRLGQSP